MNTSPDTRRALVTGANGFIGSHVVRQLLERGYDVVAAVGPSGDVTRLRGTDVETLPLDVEHLDAGTVARKLRGTTAVLHLAARGVDPRDADADALIGANVGGTLRVLELARELDAEQFVYCGSCFEYGVGTRLREDAPLHPVAAYGAAKAAATLLAHAFGRSHGLPVVALRPFTAYGPSEAAYRLIPSTIRGALAGEPIELTGGEQTRDFVYVEDVAEAFALALDAPDVAGETLNVCTGTESRVRDVAQQIVDFAGTSAELRLGSLPYRADELWTLSGDPSRTAERLGWRARTSLSDGLERTLEWFRAHAYAQGACR